MQITYERALFMSAERSCLLAEPGPPRSRGVRKVISTCAAGSPCWSSTHPRAQARRHPGHPSHPQAYRVALLLLSQWRHFQLAGYCPRHRC